MGDQDVGGQEPPSPRNWIFQTPHVGRFFIYPSLLFFTLNCVVNFAEVPPKALQPREAFGPSHPSPYMTLILGPSPMI